MTTRSLYRRMLLLSGAAVLAGTGTGRAHNGKVHVTIDKLAFVPAEIQVKVGETIEWTNKDHIVHTATVKGGWEIMIPPGQVATRIVEAGDSVDYYCRFHPNMTGKIVVMA